MVVKFNKIVITILMTLLIAAVLIASSSAGLTVGLEDPRYRISSYTKEDYYHGVKYYMYGRITGWYEPGVRGYFESEHYGFASMGGNISHNNKVIEISLCVWGYDKNGNTIFAKCFGTSRSYDLGETAETYEYVYYSSGNAFKIETRVRARYVHYEHSVKVGEFYGYIYPGELYLLG